MFSKLRGKKKDPSRDQDTEKKTQASEPKPKPSFDHLFKVVLIGDSGVGKSEIILRFANALKTTSIFCLPKTCAVEVGDKKVELQIWDTSGLERFRSITTSYYRGCHGIMLVFDVTNMESFTNIRRWLQDVDQNVYSYDVCKILVGNKFDHHKRVVDKTTAMDFAAMLDLAYMDVSAKTSMNINEVFFYLARNMLAQKEGRTDPEEIRRLPCRVIEAKHSHTSTVVPRQLAPGNKLVDTHQHPEVDKSLSHTQLSHLKNEATPDKSAQSFEYHKISPKYGRRFQEPTLMADNVIEYTEVQFLKQQTDDKNQEFHQKNENLEERVKSLEENIRTARQQLQEREQQLKKNFDTIQNVQSRLKQSEEEVQTAMHTKRILDERVMMLEESAEELRRQLQEKEQQHLRKLQEVQSQVRRTKEEAREQLRVKEQQALRNGETIRTLEDRVKELEEEVAESHQHLTDVEQQLREAEHRLTNSDQVFQDIFQRLLGQIPQSQPHWVVQRKEIALTGEELGTGGWASVKVALFRGQRLAAKCLHHQIISAHNIRLFTREMTMAAQARHPNLLQFIGATMDNNPIILTELMPTSLRRILEQGVRLTRAQIISIASDVARALNYLHLNTPDPIIHRDISSANVLLEETGDDGYKAKVSDYGSANFSRYTATAGPGNPLYSAPESGDPRRQSVKMDVYSFGLLLVEMCSGELFDDHEELIRTRVGDWPDMVGVIRPSIHRDPKRRPNMSDVITQLTQIQS